MKKKITILVSIFGMILSGASAQTNPDKITLKDAKEISYQAKSTVEVLESLLNYVTFSDNNASSLQDAIANSYKISDNQIFANNGVIIEDDIAPDAALGNTKDIPAVKYLNDLDLHYEKTNDATIRFTNILVSGIKKRDYVYVRVKFDSEFGGKHKLKNATYATRTREALVRAERHGPNQWKTFIVGINFYNPANPIDSGENNVAVTTDESENATVVSEADLAKEKEEFLQAREKEEARKETFFKEYFEMANALSNKREYKEALEMYAKAKDLKPLVPILDKKILDTKRLLAENTYENFKSKGDKAKNERRFNDAIQYYKEAFALRPTATMLVDNEIRPLTTKLDEISLPKNKLEAGNPEGAIEACDELLKEHKKEKNEYPEVYYVKGLSYMAMAEKKPEDNRLKEKALENFTQAIDYFPNYVDARLARAKFYIRHNKDYVSAITDYDVLTTNALDDSPEKPVYFNTKAKYKDAVKNYNGAFEDFSRAIALNPTNANFFVDRGELLYRMKRYDEAVKNFNEAIKLNPKNNLAYYYRGLTYVETRYYNLAGIDFKETEKLGIEKSQLNTIETISKSFFDGGQKFLLARKYPEADSLFNQALQIRNCNFEALHGKGEVRFLAAEAALLKSRPKTAEQKFRESLNFYGQATECNQNYSVAHYKTGMAHQHLKEFPKALNSFTEAIRSNPNNTVAYIERGNTKQEMGDHAKSVEDYNKAIALLNASYEVAKKGKDDALPLAIKNDISKVYQLYGQAMYHLKQVPGALTALNKALDYNKNNAEAYYYKGLVYELQKNYDKAADSYADAIKIAPHFKYYYANGIASHKINNFTQAIANYDQAIKLDTLPAVKNQHYLRGQSFIKTRMWANALKDFNEYAKSEMVNTDIAFYSDFGLVNLYLNQDAEAIKNFQHALTLQQDNPKALFGLGCAYAKTGNFDKALEMLEKAYVTRKLTKDEVKPEEEAFLGELTKVKANRDKYNQLKKNYPPAS